MIIPRVGAAVIVQNDAETIEKSLASYYPYVERIVVSTDPRRGWTGVPITPDDTLDRIRALDTDHKITIIEDDFYRFDDPMQNDTAQRQATAAALNSAGKPLHWMMQIDADEVFLDFPAVLSFLRHVPWSTRCVYWPWLQIYQTLDDGRSLVIVNENGDPHLEQCPILFRSSVRFRRARMPILPGTSFGRHIPWTAEGSVDLRTVLLHYSWAKSETRIWEKLQTWSHNKEFDIDAIYQRWRDSKTNWETMKNFHPVDPTNWPALRAFSDAELAALYRS